MIDKISVTKRTLHFHAPFKIAYESVDKAEVVVVKIETKNGHIGLGNASPDSKVTPHENIESVYDALRNKITPDFFDRPLRSLSYYHQKIQKAFDDLPSAQSAAEEAVLYLWSQETAIPLCDFFGAYRTACPTMITIGIDGEKQTIHSVKRRLDEGFRIIKLKGGINVNDDLKRVKAVSKILPLSFPLILDANQGYSLDEAKFLLRSLKKSQLAFIEQPLDSCDSSGLKILRQEKHIPIFADESAVNFSDTLRLLEDDCVDGVNIKLMKCGGAINFVTLFNLVKFFNKQIVLGCMYETNISMTTGAHLALGLPVDYVDLDSGPLDFYDDPVVGGAKVQKGIINIDSSLTMK